MRKFFPLFALIALAVGVFLAFGDHTAAVAFAASHDHIASLSGAGLAPLMMIGSTDLNRVIDLIEKQGEAWDQFKTANHNRLKTLEDEMGQVLKKVNRPGFKMDEGGERADTRQELWIDVKTKRQVPVLRHAERLSALAGSNADGFPSVGRLLRGITLGGRADDANELAEERKALGIAVDPSGGYTVAGMLASEWIDLLRANMVLSKAGARTLPMETGEVSIAKVTGDPEVYWHQENGVITASEPTFGSANLKAKTVVCLVRLSLELSQDSANIEQMLERTIINAMAGAIDSAGLVGVTTDAAAAPAGIMNLDGRNTVTSIGAPTSWDFLVDGLYELMADNVQKEDVGALIAHPAVWKKMTKLKTGITNDNTPLAMPAEVAALPKLWTTAAPLEAGTASGIIADWRDLIFGVRQSINVRVLSETFMGSNLQLAVLAYARVDFAGVRPQSFCTLEDITV